MPNLPSLREARAAKADALRQIVANAAVESRDLNETETSAFNDGRAEIERLEREITRAEFLSELERREHGSPVGNGSGDRHFDAECRSYSLVRAIAAQAGLDVDAGREREVSRELSRRSGRAPEGILAPVEVFIEKRVMTPSSGGVGITPVDPRPEMYIDILRARIVVRRLGATVLSGLVGNPEIPRLATSATTGWV